MVESYYNDFSSKSGVESTCVVMSTGSSWDSESGFHLVDFNYSKKEDYIEHLAEKYKEKLEKHYQREEKTQANYPAFEAYFEAFFQSVPRWLSSLLGLRVIFKPLGANDEVYWLVDLKTRQTQELLSIAPCNFIIEVPSLVINDCTRRHMFSAWGPSKHLKIILDRDEHYTNVANFFGLLDFYETDGFPLVTKRHMGVALRRWREILTYMRLIIVHKLLKRPLVIRDLYEIAQ
jgi:hypothetical protein